LKLFTRPSYQGVGTVSIVITNHPETSLSIIASTGSFPLLFDLTLLHGVVSACKKFKLEFAADAYSPIKIIEKRDKYALAAKFSAIFLQVDFSRWQLVAWFPQQAETNATICRKDTRGS